MGTGGDVRDSLAGVLAFGGCGRSGSELAFVAALEPNSC